MTLLIVGVVVGLLACERASIPLDPPSDASISADAAWPLEDAEPDAGLPDVGTDTGPRRFTVRVGTVSGPDPDGFVPADLRSCTFSARSALGTTAVTVDGPGRPLVWALGRLELTLTTRSLGRPSYVVSTEAGHVDLSWPGSPTADAPRVSMLRLALELSSRSLASDWIRVSSSGGWSGLVAGADVAEAAPRADLTVAGSTWARVVGEDLWVV